MTAGMREGEKNAGQHPVWEKVAPLPATASLPLEPPNRALLQPAHTAGRAHSPLTSPSGQSPSIYFRAGSRDEKAAALSLEGWPEEAERSGESNGCIY